MVPKPRSRPFEINQHNVWALANEAMAHLAALVVLGMLDAATATKAFMPA